MSNLTPAQIAEAHKIIKLDLYGSLQKALLDDCGLCKPTWSSYTTEDKPWGVLVTLQDVHPHRDSDDTVYVLKLAVTHDSQWSVY